MVANLNAFRALPNYDSLAHIELETKEGFFYFENLFGESMENCGVRPEYYMFDNDIQRKRHLKFEQ